jgi:hypothetical protein
MCLIQAIPMQLQVDFVIENVILLKENNFHAFKNNSFAACLVLPWFILVWLYQLFVTHKIVTSVLFLSVSLFFDCFSVLQGRGKAN